jgi:hypothetical protein
VTRGAATLRFGLAAAVSLLLASGCERRDRANPFDPRNSNTGGVPSLLSTLAGYRQVDVAWDVEDLDGVERVYLYRRLIDGAVTPLTPEGVEPSVHSHRDFSAQNDVDYEYRIELTITGGERAVSAWDAATPGDAVPWVADSDGGGLSRITPDARDRVLRLGRGWVLDVAVDSLDPGVWCVDYLDGLLLRYGLDGSERLRLSIPGARAVAVDLDSVSVWVGSFDGRRLERRWRDGGAAWSDSTAGFVEDLLAASPSGVWLANRDGELRLVRDDHVLVRITELRHPIALAAGPGVIYVLERGTEQGPARVRRFDAFGIPMGASDATFSSPADISGDGQLGVWIADPGRGGLVHLNGALSEDGFVPLAGVLGVTWDERAQRLWVAGSFGVKILDAAGGTVSGLPMGPRPIKVEVLHVGAAR